MCCNNAIGKSAGVCDIGMPELGGVMTFGRQSQIFVALIAILTGSSAWSADMRVPPRQIPSTSEPSERYFVFSGFDFNSFNGYFGWLGSTLAPFGGLDSSGFRVGLFGGAGSYTYDFGALTLKNTGRFTTGDILVGYGFVTSSSSTKLLIGANDQDHHLSIADPTNPVQGSKLGLKVQGDTYVSPTKETMFFALASYSTAFRSYYTEIKAGYDVSNGGGVFIGPQLKALGNARFDQWRVGLHLSGIKFGKLELELAGGYLHESDLGSGAYGTIGANIRF
jgi:Cellulose biosynthesis protein BcsS